MVATISLSRRAAQALLFFGLPVLLLLVCTTICILLRSYRIQLFLVVSELGACTIWLDLVTSRMCQLELRLHCCDYVCEQVEGTYMDQRVWTSEYWKLGFIIIKILLYNILYIYIKSRNLWKWPGYSLFYCPGHCRHGLVFGEAVRFQGIWCKPYGCNALDWSVFIYAHAFTIYWWF